MKNEWEDFERHPLRYLGSNMGVAIGLIMIWRGVWYGLDALDYWIFGGTHWVTSLFGIVLGIAILYLPHHNLRALERL